MTTPIILYTCILLFPNYITSTLYYFGCIKGGQTATSSHPPSIYPLGILIRINFESVPSISTFQFPWVSFAEIYIFKIQKDKFSNLFPDGPLLKHPQIATQKEMEYILNNLTSTSEDDLILKSSTEIKTLGILNTFHTVEVLTTDEHTVIKFEPFKELEDKTFKLMQKNKYFEFKIFSKKLERSLYSNPFLESSYLLLNPPFDKFRCHTPSALTFSINFEESQKDAADSLNFQDVYLKPNSLKFSKQESDLINEISFYSNHDGENNKINSFNKALEYFRSFSEVELEADLNSEQRETEIIVQSEIAWRIISESANHEKRFSVVEEILNSKNNNSYGIIDVEDKSLVVFLSLDTKFLLKETLEIKIPHEKPSFNKNNILWVILPLFIGCVLLLVLLISVVVIIVYLVRKRKKLNRRSKTKEKERRNENLII